MAWAWIHFYIQNAACAITLLNYAICNAYWQSKHHIWEPKPQADPACCYDDSWRH